jgi:S-ribosylhomocysteine lyase
MRLLRGVYVSRKDKIGSEIITTFDIRMTQPNFEPVMLTGEVHTIEHLAATYLRNHVDFAEKTVYFGPMGCRTGFYLLLGGDYESKDIIPLLTELYEFIRDFTGDIPGASAENCGNYSDMNLELAKNYAQKFLDEILYNIDEVHLTYPE